MVRRRHGSDPDRTRAELEKLIQEQTVLKVNYKGSVSYRNAAKVQRKCRRKVEQASERTKHAAFDSSGCSSNAKNNDNISARSPADREEREPTPRRDPSPSSCSRSAEEKREEEKEAAAAGSSPATGGISSFTSCDGRNGSRETSSPAAGRVEGGGEGEEETHSVFGHASTDLPEPEQERRTCTSARNNKQHAPQLRAAKSAARAADLGDRLVAAVWSLSERNSRGHAPLGLKEILGYLGTQAAHADGEKLTRHRVKVVLEREIEKGRLRRTRLGHITVPARRGGVITGASKASARLPANTDSAPQDRRISKQVTINTFTPEAARACFAYEINKYINNNGARRRKKIGGKHATDTSATTHFRFFFFFFFLNFHRKWPSARDLFREARTHRLTKDFGAIFCVCICVMCVFCERDGCACVCTRACVSRRGVEKVGEDKNPDTSLSIVSVLLEARAHKLRAPAVSLEHKHTQKKVRRTRARAGSCFLLVRCMPHISARASRA